MQVKAATVSAQAEGRTGWASPPSVDSSLGLKLLPTVLSLIAGSADVIGFLGLGGLFTAHITGRSFWPRISSVAQRSAGTNIVGSGVHRGARSDPAASPRPGGNRA